MAGDQGKAITDAFALFGDCNPGGRLTQTWFTGDSALPGMNDYALYPRRTYMYYSGKPLYAFGYGLSFSTFEYRSISITPQTIFPGDTLQVAVEIKNISARAGDEVPQLYIHALSTSGPAPFKQLKGFCRSSFQPNETNRIQFAVPYKEFASWNLQTHSYAVAPGNFDVWVGPSSDRIALSATVTTAAQNQAPGSEQYFSRIAKIGLGAYMLRGGQGFHRVEVYRVDGRLFLSRNITDNQSIFLKSLPAGVYLFKMIEKNATQLGKVIVP